jgi:hypothetical protein
MSVSILALSSHTRSVTPAAPRCFNSTSSRSLFLPLLCVVPRDSVPQNVGHARAEQRAGPWSRMMKVTAVVAGDQSLPQNSQGRCGRSSLWKRRVGLTSHCTWPLASCRHGCGVARSGEDCGLGPAWSAYSAETGKLVFGARRTDPSSGLNHGDGGLARTLARHRVVV